MLSRLDVQCMQASLPIMEVCVCVSVHGGWGEWITGNCSEPCGGGVLNITRSCDNPVPSCGGKFCDGMDFEELICNGDHVTVCIYSS